ncbi:hypothetical protein GRI38_11215 [Altererythrobacter aurantiacus]|uniref:Uncharacterized protein n=1 Tax=Parapontixanthobacter aurantiacus TaxID=1463599 RepID=A0A844ZGU0_9SPHN|nr:hypothetical protein [Parapontixanthobacter aurantiacus]MXO86593.1 hypothetical protein [Parapontixanthobacter aurantiacus]
MTFRIPPALLSPALLLLAASCSEPAEQAETGMPAEEEVDAPGFWTALSSHCGRTYSSQMAQASPTIEAPVTQGDMLMSITQCSDTRIVMPFYTQDERGDWLRARQWIFARDETGGLAMRYERRRQDRSGDTVTLFDAAEASGNAAVFERRGWSERAANSWRIAVDPAGKDDAQIAYELADAPGRPYRITFDASRPVPLPPIAEAQTGRQGLSQKP